MKDKFRKRAYLKAIVDERNRIIDPDCYIYPESEYLLSWREFFQLSELPNEHRRAFQEEYQAYYIYSNSALIDGLEGNEIDTFVWMKLSYAQMKLLKIKFPRSYEKLLCNLQKKYLKIAYRRYNDVPVKLRKEFEDFLFCETDSSVKWYIDYFNEDLK